MNHLVKRPFEESKTIINKRLADGDFEPEEHYSRSLAIAGAEATHSMWIDKDGKIVSVCYFGLGYFHDGCRASADIRFYPDAANLRALACLLNAAAEDLDAAQVQIDCGVQP